MMSHRTTARSYSINSVTNANDHPLPEEVLDTAIFQSAVFIEDGIHYHSIHHRIDPTSLKIYRIYYHRYMRWLFGFVIFINMMLAFVEYPTSLTLSSDIHYRDKTWRMPELNCGITESIELVCLMIFLLDCIFKFYLLGWRTFMRKPWFLLYFAMIIVSFADIGVSLSFCARRDDSPSLLYTVRVRRFCRPIFFLISSTIMKKFIKAVALTLPQIFSVLILLVLHLYVFAMIGLLVFPRPSSINKKGLNYSNNSFIPQMNLTNSLPHNLTYSEFAYLEGSLYFSSVTQAFMSLLILLTTANHPDVMMPIYQYNRFSSLYFILFLGIGCFLILNLLIAATYNQFKGFFQKSGQSSFLRRRVAFRAAFSLLARKTHQQQQRRGSRLSYVQEVVSKDLIRRLLRKARIPKKRLPQMYQKMETVSSQCLNWQQFKDVLDLATMDPTRKHRERRPYYGQIRWLQWLQLCVRHRYFSYVTHALSIINVLLITVELQVSYESALERTDSRLAYYNLVFIVYYVLEQLLKIVGYGIKGYFSVVGNIYEGLLTIMLVILEILLISYSKGAFSAGTDGSSVIFHYDSAVRVMNIVIVFRLLRIVAHVKSLRILISIIIDLFKNLSGFAGLMAIIYYIFALLGMNLFTNVDGESAPDDTTGEPFSQQCGDYDNLKYYANNFHDFASSLVTLWDIMVVNNWFVFLDKFSRDSILGGWSRIYFIIWWLLAAIIGMNLFVSLMLDTFLIKWEAVYGNQDEEGGNAADNEDAWDVISSKEHMRSDIQQLLQEQLQEPEEHTIMHNLQKHKDLMLA